MRESSVANFIVWRILMHFSYKCPQRTRSCHIALLYIHKYILLLRSSRSKVSRLLLVRLISAEQLANQSGNVPPRVAAAPPPYKPQLGGHYGQGSGPRPTRASGHPARQRRLRLENGLGYYCEVDLS